MAYAGFLSLEKFVRSERKGKSAIGRLTFDTGEKTIEAIGKRSMERLKFALIVGVLPALTFCPGLHATVFPNPLASHTQLMDNNFAAASSTFQFRLYDLGLGVNAPIFETVAFNSHDVGEVVSVTQAQDPDFNTLRAFLVNGRSDTIGLALSFDNFLSVDYAFAASEAAFFGPLPAGNNGIDFQGFPIDNIALRLDSARFLRSSYSIRATVLINSAPVPEPSTGLLAVLSGGFLAVFARRKRKR